MKVTIDRFEGNYAVVELENKTVFNMPIELLPKGAKEGSVLKLNLILKQQIIKGENSKTNG